jgi:hypothetical protein
MPDNPTTESESESPFPDDLDWQIAFEPFAGRPRDVLTLAIRFAALKKMIGELKKREAIRAIDDAIDSLYEHSDFRSAGRELFLSAINGKLTPDKEDMIHELGIRI